jgi:hypothetical protein
MARPKNPSAQEKREADRAMHFFSLASKAMFDREHKPLDREAEEMRPMLAAMPPITISNPPMADPWEEKKAADSGSQAYTEMLHRRTESLQLLILPGALEERIREVYRLCFMENPKDMSVLNDYAAHHPVLALSSPWLADLLDTKKPKKFQFRESDRCRVLEALARGFKRASNPNTWKKRVKRDDVEVARHTCGQIHGELKKFYGSDCADIKALKAEERDGAARARGLIDGKVAEIAARVPQVRLPIPEIRNLVIKGRLSDAAKVIASRIWNVREREIEARPKWQGVAEEILRKRGGRATAPKD